MYKKNHTDRVKTVLFFITLLLMLTPAAVEARLNKQIPFAPAQQQEVFLPNVAAPDEGNPDPDPTPDPTTEPTPEPTAEPTPEDTTQIVIAAGGQHTCALTSVGGVQCWGDGSSGQLGIGELPDSDNQRSTPVDVSGLASGVTAITTGLGRTCALTDTGGVKCWGTSMFRWPNEPIVIITESIPKGISGLSSGVKAIATGGAHSCALTSTGGVKCWGENFFGQLGYKAPNDSVDPVDVTGLSSGIQAITAGGEHTCALTDAGGVKCWGYNNSGQLGGNVDPGSGDPYNSVNPVDVTGLSSGIQALAAGGNHTCALTTDGGVKCWGYNLYGQVGDGTNEERLAPVAVSGLSSGVMAIAAGGNHTCALTTTNVVKCWGANYNGQLGDDTFVPHNLPTDAVGLGSGSVKAIAGGHAHTCVYMTTGDIKCWGNNESGQTGDGTIIVKDNLRTVPGDVPSVEDVQDVSTGGAHTCALTTSGGVQCWGSADYGQLGDGTQEFRYYPATVSGLSSGVQAIAAGNLHTCALTGAGGVKCWGHNVQNQAGDGIPPDQTTNFGRLTPVDVVGLSSGIQAIAAGDEHTCALTTGGGVKCWGSNTSGELGDGSSFDSYLTVVNVSGLSSGVQAITAGSRHTCALLTSGGVQCWGSNSYGAVGDGAYATAYPNPVDVSGLSAGVQAIAAGGYHTCALMTSGGVKCWGYSEFGQVGDGTKGDETIGFARLTPVDVVGLSSSVQAIAAGGAHTCALTTAGGMKCWGKNEFGQLGDSTTETRLSPINVSDLSTGVQAISTGATHTCAAISSGLMKCWGNNEYAQAGYGNRYRPVPTDVLQD